MKYDGQHTHNAHTHATRSLQLVGRALTVLVLLWLLCPRGPGSAQRIPPSSLAPAPGPYLEASENGREVAFDFMERMGTPGLSVAVAVDGEIVWAEGFGYAGLENRVSVWTWTLRSSGTSPPSPKKSGPSPHGSWEAISPASGTIEAPRAGAISTTKTSSTPWRSFLPIPSSMSPKRTTSTPHTDGT